jgi:hypothetical protein
MLESNIYSQMRYMDFTEQNSYQSDGRHVEKNQLRKALDGRAPPVSQFPFFWVLL